MSKHLNFKNRTARRSKSNRTTQFATNPPPFDGANVELVPGQWIVIELDAAARCGRELKAFGLGPKVEYGNGQTMGDLTVAFLQNGCAHLKPAMDAGVIPEGAIQFNEPHLTSATASDGQELIGMSYLLYAGTDRPVGGLLFTPTAF
jgi:hypothetical protein